jgi:GTP-binding protein EngB required for normal cell division
VTIKGSQSLSINCIQSLNAIPAKTLESAKFPAKRSYVMVDLPGFCFYGYTKAAVMIAAVDFIEKRFAHEFTI